MTTKFIRAVLFDFDGTLTAPGSLDFGAIREEIGCPKSRPVLEYINELATEKERTRAVKILEEREAEAARKSHPNEGAEETLRILRARGVKVGIISRNSLVSIYGSLRNFACVLPSDFDVILSRDDPYTPKPSPEGILAAASILEIPASQILVVGDFVFDIEAGRKAGAVTAFLKNRGTHACACPPDFELEHLGDLKDIIDRFAPLPGGKLPNRLLERFLGEIGAGDPSLLLAPKVGEDAAALPLAGEEILVLKSDPVTFATEAAGRYAVTVNVNDLAACGATPRWLLAAMLFPQPANADRILKTMKELQSEARAQGLILCGGHTEITDAVTRPVITAQLAGTAARSELIDKRSMAEGDRILLTKRLAIEGTSIIARELPDKLRDLGMKEELLERCRNFLAEPGISILKEARIAAATGKVSGMHDITEGGISTALQELSRAAGHRIRVWPDRIRVYDETREICRLLDLSPLGLIGSGSLLIVCRPGAAESLEAALRSSVIEVVCIGEALECGSGVEAVDAAGNAVPWRDFEIDEIARLFADSPRRVS